MPKTSFKVAIPSELPGGLSANRSGHFGRCDCFTVAEVDGDNVLKVDTRTNPPHVEGGCLGPVRLLEEEGITAIVVGGIGMRPLEGFRRAGIRVYLGVGPTVKDTLDAFVAGNLNEITDEAVCGGH